MAEVKTIEFLCADPDAPKLSGFLNSNGSVVLSNGASYAGVRELMLALKSAKPRYVPAFEDE